jgi:hypothetical protein
MIFCGLSLKMPASILPSIVRQSPAPPLANKAFTAKNLDELLDQQTQEFINNSRFNQIKPGSVKVSKIFEWYAKILTV